MEMIEHLTREFAYSAWANRECLRSLLAARTAPERAVAVLAHIVGAEWLWLQRLGHGSARTQVWPALPLAECEGELRELSQAWRAYLAGLGPDSLAKEIRYTNTKGEPWSNTVHDVLAHVALHATYHRGQIASLLRQAGETAASTDYIECVRRGHLARGWPA